MKKSKLFLFSILFIATISCNKSSECYSCDTKVDEFVKKNNEELSTISIVKLAQYKPEIQRATFRMYDKQRQQDVWKEKYEYILKNNPNNYTVEELQFVKKLLNFIISDGLNKERLTFINNWIQEVRGKFLWGDERLRFLVMSLDVNEENYFKNNNVSALRSASCSCNTINSGVLIDDCPTYIPACNKNNYCKVEQRGCGYFWVDPCNGDCALDIDVIDPL
ncbi:MULTISPECIES: bacteriocin fulvocin C-related protein [unclassified Sphingobacterium]|uniref:bacteriocin fulvocin C-related protein n=1 Tax=unclassified Sphingobacterium TaxID=2609468 RepID=UPI0025D60D36|nr:MULTISPECIES: bacteriocin fulvocin C-related protein [unclassified Sphingobacterium]